MRKVLLGILIIAALSLVCAGPALASPPDPAKGFSIFVEYAELWVEGGGIIAGAGYGLTESLAFGVFLNPDLEDTVGLYGCYAFDQFRVSMEITTDFGDFRGLLSGLYVFDLDPLALGVGAGAMIGSSGSSDLCVKATAVYRVDAISIYGGAAYFPDWEDVYLSAGASYNF